MNSRRTDELQPLLTPEEVAALLKLHVKTVQRRLLTGEIPNIIVCGSAARATRRVRQSDLAEYIRGKEDRRAS